MGIKSSTTFQLTLLGFIALKSWTCQFVTDVENLLNVETPLNVISA